jgi:hypothetical protein
MSRPQARSKRPGHTERIRPRREQRHLKRMDRKPRAWQDPWNQNQNGVKKPELPARGIAGLADREVGITGV